MPYSYMLLNQIEISSCVKTLVLQVLNNIMQCKRLEKSKLWQKCDRNEHFRSTMPFNINLGHLHCSLVKCDFSDKGAILARHPSTAIKT